MNRLNRYLSGAFAALLAATAPALCADLLVDDFTDAAASHIKWMNTDESTLNTSVNGGSCTLDNSASQFIGEYKHVFSSKPSVFTLSYVLKSVTGSSIGGAFFCRQPDSRSGYILTVKNGNVAVYKVTASGTSIDAITIFQKESFDLNAANNKLTVSKSGSKFNVFVNDAFVGAFTDASYNTGDLSLVTFGNVKAVFGKVQVTDVFTEASPRTSFSDNFNGNGLKYWNPLKVGSPTVNEGNGVLTVKTNAGGDAAWLYVDFEHPNFTAKIETSHKSGSKTATYGFVLVGDPPAGQATIPMAYFAITGSREFAMWSGASANLESNPAILGAAAGGQFFVDNLEIKKSSASPAYEFLANGTALGTFSAANVGFNVIGVGLFCYGDLVEVAFDNFSIVKEGSTLAINNGSKQISRAKPPLTNRDRAFYDMRGRKRYSITSTPSRIQTRAAGVYINKNGRDVAVRKGRMATE